MRRQHREIVSEPVGIGTVDSDDDLGAGTQKGFDRSTGGFLAVDGYRVLQIQDRDIRAAAKRFGEALWPISRNEQRAARGRNAVGESAQAVTAGLWAAIIFSTTILAVSAQAVVPPFAYSLTPSPTFQSPWNGVSWDRS